MDSESHAFVACSCRSSVAIKANEHLRVLANGKCYPYKESSVQLPFNNRLHSGCARVLESHIDPVMVCYYN